MSDSSTDPVRVGAILRDTYEITALIGEGGMGSVFSARHVRLPKQVAIKVLKGDYSGNPEVVSRFRREAEIASRLGHPNIVEVLDFDTLPNGSPFLVLEFLKGESLANRLLRGPMRWEETRSIAVQIGSALRVAHQAGVVHRDLKPDNIFLLPGDSTGAAAYRVKLLDFGISKLSQDKATRQTQDAVLMGTPQYMSPEQGLGKNSLTDARSDVFALGCIFYEMLSGRPAFSGESVAQIIFRIVYEAPTPLPELLPDLPANVWPAIERALAKNPDTRFPDVGALTESLTGTRLQELQEKMPVAPTPAPAPHGGTMQLDSTYIPPPPTPASAPAPSSASGPLAAMPHGVREATPVPLVNAVLQATPVPLVNAVLQATPVPQAPAKKKPTFPVVAFVIGIITLFTLAVGVLVVVEAVNRNRNEQQQQQQVQVQVPRPPPPAPPEQAARDLPRTEPTAQTPPEQTSHRLPRKTRVEDGPDEESSGLPLEPQYPGAAGDAAQVQAALEAGDANLALTRAERMQRSQLSVHGYALITQAHCRLHDLSAAQASFRNVRGRYRAPVTLVCRSFGIQLRNR